MANEWSADYPRLVDFATGVLKHRPVSFKLDTIDDDLVADVCLSIASEDPSGIGLIQGAVQVVNGVMTPKEFKVLLARTFYHVGLFGLKTAPHEAESWADELGRSISTAEIGENTSVVVNPAYRRALGLGRIK